MKRNESGRFAKSTAAVLANFGSVATEPLLTLWFDVATDDNISIDQWEAAAKCIIRQRKYTSQPTYADFLEIIKGIPVTEADVANSQAAAVMKQVRELGAYRYPVFDDPTTKALMSSRWSWAAVCLMTETEMKWWVKEFVEAYQSEKKSECLVIGEGKSIKNLKLIAGGIGN